MSLLSVSSPSHSAQALIPGESRSQEWWAMHPSRDLDCSFIHSFIHSSTHLFTPLFIHLFNKYLLSAWYRPKEILVARAKQYLEKSSDKIRQKKSHKRTGATSPDTKGK